MRVNINQPLIIHGDPGTGKTTLANKLLSDTILTTINFYNSKIHKNIKDHIVNCLKRKSISLMMNISKSRGLLIDDIDIIYKNDITNFHNIILFLKEKVFYDSKIIIISSETFIIKNKHLKNLKYDTLKINIRNNYEDICNKIIKDKKITLTKKMKNNCIKNSNYNLNVFISFVENAWIDEKDNYYSNNTISEKIINKDIEYSEILRLSNDSRIILSLLDNIYKYLSTEKSKRIVNIYNNYNNYLLIDNYSKEYIRDLLPIYTTCIINYYVNSKGYNKYISNNLYFNRSSLSVNNKVILNDFTEKHRMILLYLLNINQKANSNDIEKILSQIKDRNKKGYMIYNKLYELLY